MKIIGLSGTNGSGKDTIAHILEQQYGFYFASASALLEAELKNRNKPFEREQKRQLSAEWRQEFGTGAIVDKGIAAAQSAGFEKLVVGSLRNSGEIDRVHQLNGRSIWVDADPEIRYQRIISANRGRVEDKKTYQQFLAEEAVEMESGGDPNKLDMATVKQKADIIIMNNFDSVEAFTLHVKKVLKEMI